MARRGQVRAGAELALVLAVAAAAVFVLHRLGSLAYVQIDWGHPLGWLAAARPEDAVMAVLRLVGLGVGWWVLITTAVYVAARVTGLPAAIRAVEWAALPPVRRVADRAVAVTIAGSSVLGGPAGVAAAEEPPAPPVPSPEAVQVEAVDATTDELTPQPGSHDGADDALENYEPAPAGSPEPNERGREVDGEDDSPPAGVGERSRGAKDAVGSADMPPEADTARGAERSQPVAATSEKDTATRSRSAEDSDSANEAATPGAAGTEAEGGESAAQEAGEAAPATATHTVKPGEHLWGIAEAQLRQVREHEPTGEEVVAYWRAVVAANSDRLVSGDPDLVYPGETVVLPEVPAD